MPCLRRHRPRRGRAAGFTLLELLIVLAVVAILAAILFPVFQGVRESARRAACLSGERQLGLAISAYTQDSDETFPNGINVDAGGRYWPGEGWAGQTYGYFRVVTLLDCPDDPTVSPNAQSAVVSYGYNINVAGPVRTLLDPIPPAVSTTGLAAPSRTVLLFEVSDVTANAADSREGTEPGGVEGQCVPADGTPAGSCFSASANGLDNRLYAQDSGTSPLNQYATGQLGGRRPPNPNETQFRSARGRHGGGSNFLLADGHAQWLPGGAVSSGINAPAEDCFQDDVPSLPGCTRPPGSRSAAGTGAPGFRATFSTR